MWGRWQLSWQDPAVLVSFASSQHPPTPLGAQSWCSSSPMGGGTQPCRPGLWEPDTPWTLSSEHGGPGCSQCCPRPLSPACVTWCHRDELGQPLGFSAWGARGAQCPQARGPQTPAWAEAPHCRTRSWCCIHQGPSSPWGPLWAVLPSPAVTGAGGRPGINTSPLGTVSVPRASAAGDVLTRTCGG